jgi:hypothetical protein
MVSGEDKLKKSVASLVGAGPGLKQIFSNVNTHIMDLGTDELDDFFQLLRAEIKLLTPEIDIPCFSHVNFILILGLVCVHIHLLERVLSCPDDTVNLRITQYGRRSREE